MVILSHTPNLFTPEKAIKIAQELCDETEENWTYKPDHDPHGTGYSRIKIYDEDNEFVGFL